MEYIMSTACPISFAPKINSTLLRINSIIYIIILYSAIYFNQPFIILLLIAIFISKNININAKCLLDYFSKFTASLLHLPEKKIDPAPKKLANAMGLFGSLVIFLSLYFKSDVSYIPIAVMSVAFFLEAAFDYCIGCKIYALTQKLKR